MRPRYWLLALALFVVVVGAVLLTTTLAKPQVAQITLPKQDAAEPPTPVAAGDLTLLLSGSQVHYYFGPNTPGHPPQLHPAASMQALDKMLKSWPQRTTSYVHIKSGEEINYKQVVALLDEMNSTGQRRYGMELMSAADQLLLAHRGLL